MTKAGVAYFLLIAYGIFSIFVNVRLELYSMRRLKILNSVTCNLSKTTAKIKAALAAKGDSPMSTVDPTKTEDQAIADLQTEAAALDTAADTIIAAYAKSQADLAAALALTDQTARIAAIEAVSTDMAAQVSKLQAAVAPAPTT